MATTSADKSLELGQSRSSAAVEIVRVSEKNGDEVDLEIGGVSLERDCRICHLSLESPDFDDAIVLGCSCKEDLANAHKRCAEAWFKIKGNKTCEICGAVARNVTGPSEVESMEQWSESNNATPPPRPPASNPTDTQNFWEVPISGLPMKTLCPNDDFEDGLETVLEVPIPDEEFADPGKSGKNGGAWHSVKSWIKPPQVGKSSSPTSIEAAAYGGKNTEIQLLLGVVGAPLIPLPLKSDHASTKCNIRDHPIEESMAKYIIEQYLGAVGGERALNSIGSLCAVGKVRMVASEFSAGEDECGGNRAVKGKNLSNGGGEMGGFVLWQKKPELWCLELVLSGCKISAGSDGKVAWRQTPWHHSHASRGPPRPLRRSLQGLDPLATAKLFSNSVCIGEKEVNDEDCFILKLEADPSALKSRSSSNVEIIRHTVWGYFSQRTGLLVQLDDCHMLGIKHPGSNDSIFWETTMESLIQDYKDVDGINIAHKGKTSVSLFRFGEIPEKHSRTRMEEIWEIKEMDFNIKGLSMDCFLPPGDLKKDDEEEHVSSQKHIDEQKPTHPIKKNELKSHFIIRPAPLNVNPAKVVAVDTFDS